MGIPLQGFDFTALDRPDFKEDAVREEIISPLLHALGYSVSGRYQIARSRPLLHPFVSIGSIRRAINIYPDYLLVDGKRVLWVLDAKAPWESIDDPSHLSQVYTYAIHRDVRAEWYAVCNGREFALHCVADMSSTARLRFSVSQLSAMWEEVRRQLVPETFGTAAKPPPAFADATKLEETRTASTALDVAIEAVAFVQALVANNKGVSEQWNSLVDNTREMAGGRFKTGRLVPIEWLVSNYHSDLKVGGGTQTWNAIFLVQEPLIFGFHHGYCVEENVVARVRADSVNSFVESKEDEFELKESRLTLAFEGFVTAELRPATPSKTD